MNVNRAGRIAGWVLAAALVASGWAFGYVQHRQAAGLLESLASEQESLLSERERAERNWALFRRAALKAEMSREVARENKSLSEEFQQRAEKLEDEVLKLKRALKQLKKQ